jgi:hypothetical protein
MKQQDQAVSGRSVCSLEVTWMFHKTHCEFIFGVKEEWY